MKFVEKKKSVTVFSVLCIAGVIVAVLCCCGRYSHLHETRMESIVPAVVEDKENEYDTFNILTCIRKLNGLYFMVDCYHDRILYSDDPKTAPKDWKVMTREIKHGHTIDSDGELYLCDDTENNRVLVFREGEQGFEMTGEFKDIGVLPHFVVYDDKSHRFYVLSSMTGELYVFRNDDGEAVLEKKMGIKELDGSYVRSFTIIDDEIYFVSGNMNIIKAGLSDLHIIERYPVDPSIGGMIQLEKIGDCFFITVSTDADFNQDYATMISTRDLASLAENDYETVYGTFEGGGTPYYIGKAGEHYYLTEHRLADHQLWQFDVEDDEIINVVSVN
ncbi:MAG: hypothetical protein K5770_04570 [Lachnospiraceae bacterium]|nr:hypothetical protein [Lachnospiraceae bacterium]